METPLKLSIHRELTELLYRNLAQGLFSIFVMATFLVWQIKGSLEHAYSIWYVALTINLIIGQFIIFWYFRTKSNIKLLYYHYYAYVIGSSLTAIFFGIAASVLMPDDILHQVLVMMIVICIVGGAVQGLLASYVASFAYIIFALVPLLIWEYQQILHGQEIFIGIFMATLGTSIYLAAEVHSGHQTIVNNIKLKLENMSINQELERQKTKIEFLSKHDTLTMLYNRLYLEETLFNLKSDSSKQLSLSVFMFDIDHFKEFNDTMGHNAGDEILREFGRLIKQFFNTNDLSFRYGGEEFLIILEGVSSERALQYAEAFRSAIKSHYFHVLKQHVFITFSGGIATLHEHGEDIHAVITAADQALYYAKNNGRDQIQMAKAISQKTSVK